jgi:hypothetical protein
VARAWGRGGSPWTTDGTKADVVGEGGDLFGDCLEELRCRRLQSGPIGAGLLFRETIALNREEDEGAEGLLLASRSDRN